MNKLHKTVHPPVRPARALSVAPFEGFDRSNCLAVQQEIIDDQLADFTEGELKVMLSVTRATNGGQRESVPLSVRILCDGGSPDVLPGRGTGLSPRTVQAACTALEASGCLKIVRRMSPDGSGLPSLFTLPLVVPGMRDRGEPTPARFPGYAAGRRVRLPLLVFDRLLSELSGAELKVLLYILRHTFCSAAADEVMPMARLVENTGLSLRHTRLAVAGLTSRGVVLVQHRQDAERGKLASRFGVRVIGEAPPFSAAHTAPGAAAQSSHPDEHLPEQTRPFWLVPGAEPKQAEERAPSDETPGGEAIAETRAEVPSVLQVVPTSAGPVEPAPMVPPTPLRALPPRPSVPVVLKTIPASMIKDNHPAWSAAKQLLAERLPYQVFVDRIAPTSTVGGESAELLVAVQDEYHRWWLESKLGRQVRQALEDAGFGNIRMRYLNFAGQPRNDGERL